MTVTNNSSLKKYKDKSRHWRWLSFLSGSSLYSLPTQFLGIRNTARCSAAAHSDNHQVFELFSAWQETAPLYAVLPAPAVPPAPAPAPSPEALSPFSPRSLLIAGILTASGLFSTAAYADTCATNPVLYEGAQCRPSNGEIVSPYYGYCSSGVCYPNCPAGYGVNGAGDCIMCVASQYSPGGMATCQTCPPDTKSSSAGAVSCDSCPTNTVVNPGQTGCDDLCAPGYTGNPNSCTMCIGGQYKEGYGNTPCLQCPSDKWSPSGTTSLAGCQTCPPTQTPNASQSGCDNLCGPGYTGTPNNCMMCLGGTYKDGYGNTSCQPCPAGTISSSGASACTSCPSGYVPNVARDNCVPNNGVDWPSGSGPGSCSCSVTAVPAADPVNYNTCLASLLTGISNVRYASCIPRPMMYGECTAYESALLTDPAYLSALADAEAREDAECYNPAPAPTPSPDSGYCIMIAPPPCGCAGSPYPAPCPACDRDALVAACEDTCDPTDMGWIICIEDCWGITCPSPTPTPAPPNEHEECFNDCDDQYPSGQGDWCVDFNNKVCKYACLNEVYPFPSPCVTPSPAPAPPAPAPSPDGGGGNPPAPAPAPGGGGGNPPAPAPAPGGGGPSPSPEGVDPSPSPDYPGPDDCA